MFLEKLSKRGWETQQNKTLVHSLFSFRGAPPAEKGRRHFHLGYANERLVARSSSLQEALEKFEQELYEEVESTIRPIVIFKGQLVRGQDGIELFLSMEKRRDSLFAGRVIVRANGEYRNAQTGTLKRIVLPKSTLEEQEFPMSPGKKLAHVFGSCLSFPSYSLPILKQLCENVPVSIEA